MTNLGDSYSGQRPCRFERFLSSVSVSSIDVSVRGGKHSGPPAMTKGESAAKLSGLQVPGVEGLISPCVAREAAEWLISYKYLGQREGRSFVRSAGLIIATSLAIQKDWKLEPKGCLVRCVEVAIDDIIALQPYNMPIRAWSALIGLDNHMQWTRAWSARYQDIRYYIQALEMAAIEYIRRAG